MIKSQITHSAEETQKIATELAGKILMLKSSEQAVVLVLSGDLGAGKTTFLQGFARGIGIEEAVNSPTFIIMKKFQIPHSNSKIQNTKYKYFYHFDLYRLKNEKEVEFLDFKKIISRAENIVAIEWPGKIEKLLPKNIIKISFNNLEETKREIVVQ